MSKQDKRTKLYEYAEVVRKAKLDCKAKALLWHYAYTFNWESQQHSFYSQRTICSEVGLSQGTYYIKRNYLEELGWIQVIHRGYDKPCLVRPLVGQDDPDYENKSWAKWHFSNRIEESIGGANYPWAS